MTLTEIKATMNYLIDEAEREQAARRCYKSLDKAGYKWVLSPDILTQIEENIYDHCISLRRFEATHLYSIPVEVDYRTRDKIELWRRIGEN